jgi:hypothetical protein
VEGTIIEPAKSVERSVDSLQKIYAVVIALAISQAIQSLLKGPDGSGDFNLQRLASGLPGFVAFLVTLVPFWHGMNRHLDRCYLEKASAVVQGALLFDFGTFCVEACLLFAAGWSLRSGIETFYYLGALLVVDMAWAFISHQIHFSGKRSHAVRWSTVNVIAIGICVLIVEFPFERKPLVLMVMAVLRTIADYGICWDFYFPPPTA